MDRVSAFLLSACFAFGVLWIAEFAVEERRYRRPRGRHRRRYMLTWLEWAAAGGAVAGLVAAAVATAWNKMLDWFDQRKGKDAEAQD